MCAHCLREVTIPGVPSAEFKKTRANYRISFCRLKITLNLPPIEPRPPIPPRVYKRLYTHLDNILPGRQVRSTPSKPKQGLSSPALGSAIKSVPNQGFDRSVSRSARKVSATDITLVDTPTKSTGRGFVKSIQPQVGLHPWIRGVLAFLVAEFRREDYGKFVLAGVEYAIAPGGRRTNDKWISSHLPATVAAIFVVAMDRLATILGSVEPDVESLVDIMKKTLDIMNHAREALDVKGLTEAEFWDGWTNPKLPDVGTAIKRVREDWIDADWYLALEDVASENVQRAKSKGKGRQRRDVRETMGIHKADTLHQPRYNYLSEKRQEEYKVWLQSVAGRLADQGAGDLDDLETELGLRTVD